MLIQYYRLSTCSQKIELIGTSIILDAFVLINNNAIIVTLNVAVKVNVLSYLLAYTPSVAQSVQLNGC